jgi:hypothetical protein
MDALSLFARSFKVATRCHLRLVLLEGRKQNGIHDAVPHAVA